MSARLPGETTNRWATVQGLYESGATSGVPILPDVQERAFQGIGSEVSFEEAIEMSDWITDRRPLWQRALESRRPICRLKHCHEYAEEGKGSCAHHLEHSRKYRAGYFGKKPREYAGREGRPR